MSNHSLKKNAASPAVNRDVLNAASVEKPDQRDGQTTTPATMPGVTTDHHAGGLGAGSAGVLPTRKRILPPDAAAESTIPYKTRNIISKNFADEVSFVFFDLETGGLQYLEHDILQISALCGDKKFQVYIEPTRPISKEASDVNKLTMTKQRLHYKMEPVNTVPIDKALQRFIEFLKKIPEPVLVGFYSKKFDLPFLRFYLKENDLWEAFLPVVVGYVDIWIIFKEEVPNRSSYKQVDLVKDLLGEEYETHAALEKIKALQNLSKLVKDKLLNYRFGAKAIGLR